jgi:hypothetical protein
LFLKLTFLDTTIVFECKKNVKSGQLSEFQVGLPVLGLQNEGVSSSPSGDNIDIKPLEQRDYLGDASASGRTGFLLEMNKDMVTWIDNERMGKKSNIPPLVVSAQRRTPQK